MRGFQQRLRSGNSIRDAAAKDFSGGLNTTDSPLNMSSKYCTELRNLYPEPNGRLRVRYGTQLFATLPVDKVIVNMESYSGVLVCVTADGLVYTVTSAGVVTARTFTPAWAGPITSVNFSQFGGKLIISNVANKPLVINAAFTVSYLVDAATGLNTFVPRASFFCTHNNYNIAAGILLQPSTLSIGSRGTDGTFLGAAAPNDAVEINLASYINRGSPVISGIASFRDQLIVTFDEVILAIQLGTYDGADHIPNVADTVENVGSVSNRCIVPLGDDVLFMDLAGISSIKRALITATLSPVRESTLIATNINDALANLPLATLERSTFAIHDRIESQILFFVPNGNPVTETTENTVFVYSFNVGERYRSFTTFDTMPYRCGCRTVENRIFFGQGRSVFRYGTRFEPTYGDLRNVAGTDVQLTQYSMTTPWTDLRDPVNLKYAKYVSVLAEGNGPFKLEAYTDRQAALPDLSMEFFATDAPVSSDAALWRWFDDLGLWDNDIGFWDDAGDAVLRPANTAQLYAWTSKFRRIRFTISGSATTAIAFIGINMQYLTGSIRR